MDASFLKRHRPAKVDVQAIHDQKGASTMKLGECGIDLAKSVFQIHGVDLHGKPCLCKQLRRAEMLTAPQFVKPYVKTNKNDTADAEAICEAVTRPNMRFVSIKTASQQALLAIHRARQGFVKARTAHANQIRGLLAEFGIVIPQGLCNLGHKLVSLSNDSTGQLPGSFCNLLQRLAENLKELDRQVSGLEKRDSAPARAK